MNIQFIKPHIAAFFIVFFSTNVRAEYHDMVVFGDSLSDTGNLVSLGAEFPSPPFYEGNRISNGPVAVEYLANLLGLDAAPSLHLIGPAIGSNYAVAGANARAVHDTPIDLPDQVDAYLQNHNGTASANSLFVVFIGGNDVREARGKSTELANTILHDAVNTIDTQIRILIEAGAKTIVAVNSPDIAVIPETRLMADTSGNPDFTAETNAKSRQFNKLLAKKIRAIECDTKLDLVLFDVFGYVNKLIRDHKAYAYKNVTVACFSSVTNKFARRCNFGQNFSHFLFFDEIHPTARTHERISRALFSVVPE